MITNQRQYQITRASIGRMEEALAKVDEQNSDLDPRLRAAMRQQLESQIDELRDELAGYEQARRQRLTARAAAAIADLPATLIRGRIAAGLTQKQLAERLGLKEQQIQHYEATRYAGVSLKRVQAVAAALTPVKRRPRRTAPRRKP